MNRNDEQDLVERLMTGEVPVTEAIKRTVVGYKIFHVRRDGTIGPLFINRKQVVPQGEWLPAEDPGPQKGYAHRPGWHAAPAPEAPHLMSRSGKLAPDRKWYKVHLRDAEKIKRPKAQGGHWFLAKHMKVIGPVEEMQLGHAQADTCPFCKSGKTSVQTWSDTGERHERSVHGCENCDKLYTVHWIDGYPHHIHPGQEYVAGGTLPGTMSEADEKEQCPGRRGEPGPHHFRYIEPWMERRKLKKPRTKQCALCGLKKTDEIKEAREDRSDRHVATRLATPGKCECEREDCSHSQANRGCYQPANWSVKIFGHTYKSCDRCLPEP